MRLMRLYLRSQSATSWQRIKRLPSVYVYTTYPIITYHRNQHDFNPITPHPSSAADSGQQGVQAKGLRKPKASVASHEGQDNSKAVHGQVPPGVFINQLQTSHIPGSDSLRSPLAAAALRQRHWRLPKLSQLGPNGTMPLVYMYRQCIVHVGARTTHILQACIWVVAAACGTPSGHQRFFGAQVAGLAGASLGHPPQFADVSLAVQQSAMSHVLRECLQAACGWEGVRKPCLLGSLPCAHPSSHGTTAPSRPADKAKDMASAPKDKGGVRSKLSREDPAASMTEPRPLVHASSASGPGGPAPSITVELSAAHGSVTAAPTPTAPWSAAPAPWQQPAGPVAEGREGVGEPGAQAPALEQLSGGGTSQGALSQAGQPSLARHSRLFSQTYQSHHASLSGTGASAQGEAPGVQGPGFMPAMDTGTSRMQTSHHAQRTSIHALMGDHTTMAGASHTMGRMGKGMISAPPRAVRVLESKLQVGCVRGEVPATWQVMPCMRSKAWAVWQLQL